MQENFVNVSIPKELYKDICELKMHKKQPFYELLTALYAEFMVRKLRK